MQQGQLNEGDYDRERLEERVWRLARERDIGRRRFFELVGLASAGSFLAGCGQDASERRLHGPANSTTTTGAPAAPSPWVKPISEEKFIIHKTNAEMRWEQMRGRGYTTPNDLFFIRNHTETARVDRGSWRLRVQGSGVARPLDLGYDELVKLGQTTVTRFVECAGNGRVFFGEALGHKAEGSPWRLGAIGVAEWTGVPLGAVLERAGVRPTTRDVMPVGLDELMVRRPMPLAKAMAEDTLLVYGMNGEDLPPDHGAPVRALVPGWVGAANVKWVGQVEVSAEPLFSDWNTTSYVLLGPGYQPQGPAKGPVLTTLGVKSALELPWPATMTTGHQTVSGRSWSATGRIRRVEYQVDDGPWRPARLEGTNEPTAWTRWSFDWDATPGSHTLRTRATDDQGNTQPDSWPFNQQGYLYGAVVAHPVTVA
ncbi:MAG: sulfite oxidase [Pseudonocardiaceae bacterium]